MSPNIIGLGLLVAGLIFLIAAALWSGVVLWILGTICLIGGVGALFMTWQRKRRVTA
jgi:membrane-bound ClpP family serine protease